MSATTTASVLPGRVNSAIAGAAAEATVLTTGFAEATCCENRTAESRFSIRAIAAAPKTNTSTSTTAIQPGRRLRSGSRDSILLEGLIIASLILLLQTTDYG